MKYTLPNQLTLFRIILTPVFYFIIIQPESSFKLAAAAIFFVASVTDWYDGYFARRFNLTSRWGQFMDPLADKFLVSTALIVFAQLDYIVWWMVILVVLRDIIITGLRIFALYIGKPIITSSFAKWKTFLQMGFIFALLIYMNIPWLPEIHLHQVSNIWFLWTTLVFSTVVLFTAISGIHYLIMNFAHVSELTRRIFKKIITKRKT